MAFSDSLGRLAASLLAILRNRLELAAVEFEEEALRLFSFLLSSLVALFFLGLAFTLAVFLIVVIFWDTQYRIPVILGMTLLFGTLGVKIGMTARYNYQQKPRLLNSTLDELTRDMASLRAASDSATPPAPPHSTPRQ